MAASEVSSTDAAIFRKLANPDVVNVNLGALAAPKANAKDVKGETPNDTREGTARDSATRDGATRENAKKSESPEDAPRASVKRSYDDVDSGVTKHSILLELHELEAKGVRLSRTFTLEDSLEDLEFELHSHVSNLHTRTTVNFMRDALKLIISGIEVGNARLGPFLDIQGWAAEATSDMSRYDPALERIYKRYCRRQQMSPLFELGWLLIGSMLTWHFRNKLMAPLRPRASQQTPPRPAPRTRAPERTTGRKVLRSPGPIIGGMMT